MEASPARSYRVLPFANAYTSTTVHSTLGSAPVTRVGGAFPSVEGRVSLYTCIVYVLRCVTLRGLKIHRSGDPDS